MNLQEIKYGNPAQPFAHHLSQEGVFDSYIETFTQESFEPPKNASMTTLNELIELGMLQSNIKSMDDFNYHSHIDGNLIQFMLDRLNALGIKANYDVLYKIADELSPTLIKLKMHFQRPRPFQLAYYRQLNLYPQLSAAAHTPSYPSGHALQSYFICKLYSFKYKSIKNDLLSISEDVCESRKIMGLHYESDNEFAKQIANTLLQSGNERIEIYLQYI